MKNNFEERRTIALQNISQITTRGNGTFEKGETFKKEDIDFGSASHLNIHQSGEIAGSQFNGNIFSSPEEIVSIVKSNLPNELNYDQFGRCEITAELTISDNEPVGWSGVKSIDEIKKINTQAQIVKEARIPGGIKGEENGTEGTWYPEMIRNEIGAFVVAVNESGEVKNEKAKFEPFANIAKIPENSFGDALKTKKITIIIQKDRTTSKPSLLTMFPGENAPAFPSKIDTEDYKADSLNTDSQENKYWRDHAFLKPIKE